MDINETISRLEEWKDELIERVAPGVIGESRARVWQVITDTGHAIRNKQGEFGGIEKAAYDAIHELSSRGDASSNKKAAKPEPVAVPVKSEPAKPIKKTK